MTDIKAVVAELRDLNLDGVADLIEQQGKELAEAQARVVVLETATRYMGGAAESALKTASKDIHDWREDMSEIESTAAKAIALTDTAAIVQKVREKPSIEARVERMVESCGVSWWVTLFRTDRPEDAKPWDAGRTSLFQFLEAPDMVPPAEQRARETAAELNEFISGPIAIRAAAGEKK